MITKAAILEQQGKPLRIAELEMPELRERQVLVRVEWSGLCRSQLMEIDGQRGADPYLPHLLGHEGAGTVMCIGPETTKVQCGDQVVLTWIRGEGGNGGGVEYKEGDSIINAGPVATFATMAIVSENCCVAISKEIPGDVASLLGCAIPTGAGIVLNEMQPAAGSSLVVWGVGGIGLAALAGAVIAECNPIVAIDLVDEKLERAKNFGATHLVRGDHPDLEKKLHTILGGKGFDFAVEAAGKASIIEKAFMSVRDQGGLCVFASHPPEGEFIKLEPHALIRGKMIRGSWGGACQIDRDVPKFADLYLEGRLPLEQLISHRFGLDQINEAFSVLKEGAAQRILINLISDKF